MTDYLLVTGIPQGLSKEDKSKVKGGLHNIGTQEAPQPWQITAVRSNCETTNDGQGNVDKVASAWLMSGEFSTYPWWGDEQATKQVCADALIAIGVKNVPAVINNIETEEMAHAAVLTMLHDDAVFWSEEQI